MGISGSDLEWFASSGSFQKGLEEGILICSRPVYIQCWMASGGLMANLG